MNTLFVKTDNFLETDEFTFTRLGISQCYFKSLSAGVDKTLILRKTHRHAGYETHIIISGSQDYEIENKKLTVYKGEILLIPPFVRHRAICETNDFSKRAISFTLTENSKLLPSITFTKSYVVTKYTENLISNINLLETEKTTRLPLSEAISSLIAMECIIILLRLVGIKNTNYTKPVLLEDSRVSLAKQYIKDNIQKGVSVDELANYCYLSTKQLSRLFEKSEKSCCNTQNILLEYYNLQIGKIFKFGVVLLAKT